MLACGCDRSREAHQVVHSECQHLVFLPSFVPFTFSFSPYLIFYPSFFTLLRYAREKGLCASSASYQKSSSLLNCRKLARVQVKGGRKRKTEKETERDREGETERNRDRQREEREGESDEEEREGE